MEKIQEAALFQKEFLQAKVITVIGVWCRLERMHLMPGIFLNVILCCWAINAAHILFLISKSKNNTAVVEHEATTSKIGEDQIFYCNQRGIDTETAVALIVNGFAKEVMNQLPMEFAVEAQKLLAISLEGSVG